jgi:hypothetical protein
MEIKVGDTVRLIDQTLFSGKWAGPMTVRKRVPGSEDYFICLHHETGRTGGFCLIRLQPASITDLKDEDIASKYRESLADMIKWRNELIARGYDIALSSGARYSKVHKNSIVPTIIKITKTTTTVEEL